MADVDPGHGGGLFVSADEASAGRECQYHDSAEPPVGPGLQTRPTRREHWRILSLGLPGFVAAEAGLSYLGLGVQPPTASWGNLVADGREYLRSAWWVSLFPGSLVFAAVMAFNLLGDGLRDAFDPRMRDGTRRWTAWAGAQPGS